MQQHLAGCPARTRLGNRLNDSVSRQLPSVAAHRCVITAEGYQSRTAGVVYSSSLLHLQEVPLLPRACVHRAISHLWFSPCEHKVRTATNTTCPFRRLLSATSSSRQLTQQRLAVSCPAIEQDTEVPSTSGRTHTDGK